MGGGGEGGDGEGEMLEKAKIIEEGRGSIGGLLADGLFGGFCFSF